MTVARPMENLKIRIDGRDFTVSCDEGQRENLLDAAELLNSEITNIQNMSRSKMITLEASAIMAALNFAGELLLRNGDQSHENQEISDSISKMIRDIDTVLQN